MTTSQNAEIKNQIRVTDIIFYSLLVGLLLFFVIVIVLIQDKVQETGNDLNMIFTFVVPLFGLVMMFISRMIYNQMISKSDSDSNLLQKISYFRTAKIISWAMIEGACFLSLVATMLTSNYLYVAVFIFLFGYFFLMKPSKESFIRDMHLNSDESDLILKS
jgi:predicted membrane channel-forming protein YqfA (hemolysin III family)